MLKAPAQEATTIQEIRLARPIQAEEQLICTY